MNTQAYVSGRLGKALLVSTERRWIIDRDLRRHEPYFGELNELLSETAEVKSFWVHSEEHALECLKGEILFQDALFLFLTSCDSDLSLSTRLMCAQELEQLLEDEPLTERLVSRLLARPMPASVRANRRQTASYFESFNLLSVCIRRVFGLQEACDEMRAIWELVAAKLPAEQAADLEAEFIEDGTMASIVVALSKRDLHSFNAEFVSQSVRRREPSLDQAARWVLSEIRSALRPLLSRRVEHQRALPLKDRRCRHSGEDVDVIGQATARRREEESPSRLTSFEAKTQVDKQIVAITNEFFKGREDLAEKYIADLVNFQLSHSDREHLAKSLSNLSALALDANRLEMADKLSLYAIDFGPDDPVVFTGRAEVLKQLGSFGAALAAFQEAKIRFPESDYAWVGIADVLREMGKFEQSLTAYREAEERFPDVPVPFNGYVSVLRAQARRRDAIEYALKVVGRFPYDAVSRAQLAATLRDQGKYYQALGSYEAALRLDRKNFLTVLGYVGTLCLTDAGIQGSLNYLEDSLRIMPEHPGLLNSKASFLRRAEMLSDSLAVSEKLMSSQPTYSPARFNHAATLVAMGELEEAKRTLPSTQVLRSEIDWHGPRIYSIALIAEGHFDEAAEILQRALQECPWRKQLVKLRTTMGYVQMKLGKVPDSIASLEKDLSLVDDNTKQLRMVLLGQAHNVQGNYSVANTMLGRMVKTQDAQLGLLRQRFLSSVQRFPHSLVEIPDHLEIQVLLAA